jgi:hypothetical protein
MDERKIPKPVGDLALLFEMLDGFSRGLSLIGLRVSPESCCCPLEAIREVFTGIEFAVAGRGVFKY